MHGWLDLLLTFGSTINTPENNNHYVSEEGRQAAQEKLDRNF